MNDDVILDAINNLFISLFTINDFKTLFLILAAIFLRELISNPATNVSINIAQIARKKLQINSDDNISDRSIISVLYCFTSLIAWFGVNTIHPEFSTQQKLISAITWPFFSYVLFAAILLVITPFWMLPYDLLKFTFFFYKRLTKK